MRQSMKDFFKRVKMDAILSAILCIVLGAVSYTHLTLPTTSRV